MQPRLCYGGSFCIDQLAGYTASREARNQAYPGQRVSMLSPLGFDALRLTMGGSSP